MTLVIHHWIPTLHHCGTLSGPVTTYHHHYHTGDSTGTSVKTKVPKLPETKKSVRSIEKREVGSSAFAAEPHSHTPATTTPQDPGPARKPLATFALYIWDSRSKNRTSKRTQKLKEHDSSKRLRLELYDPTRLY